jgi:hypothetical protein
MMLIYRVEHSKYGRGPYRTWSYNYGSWHKQSDGPRHPEPRDDFTSRDWEVEGMAFGFNSPEQLAAWFTPAELKHLIPPP